MNCGPLSEMIRGLAAGCFSLARFQNDLDVGLRHRLAQIPMDDGPAIAVQHAAQIVERARDVDVAHVDMPMLMRLRRLLEARAFLRRLPVPFAQQPRLTQHPPNAGRAHRHDVGVQHHERKPAIALQRILQMEGDDRLLLPILQPKISGNPAVVLVELGRSVLASRRTCLRSPPTNQ